MIRGRSFVAALSLAGSASVSARWRSPATSSRRVCRWRRSGPARSARARAVFAGSQRERFEVEVLGVLRDLSPGTELHPGAPDRTRSRDDRRHRRHERQPGLDRRPAGRRGGVRLAVRERGDRGHHADRDDARHLRRGAAHHLAGAPHGKPRRSRGAPAAGGPPGRGGGRARERRRSRGAWRGDLGGLRLLRSRPRPARRRAAGALARGARARSPRSRASSRPARRWRRSSSTATSGSPRPAP